MRTRAWQPSLMVSASFFQAFVENFFGKSLRPSGAEVARSRLFQMELSRNTFQMQSADNIRRKFAELARAFSACKIR